MGFTVEQMRVYQKQRYDRRMVEARQALGGKCAACSSTESLEVDHLDRTAKVANLSSMTNLSERRWREELKKCQLLCKPCHVARTIEQRAVPHGGGKAGRRGCKCEPCRLARNRRRRELHAERGRGVRLSSSSS